MHEDAVDVVIATRQRPELVRRAIASVVAQDHPGVIRTLVVFDGEEPDPGVVSSDPRRPVVAQRNERTPGLSGSRNTGLLAADADVIAFLDDDDVWRPGKMSAQLAALAARPDAVMSSTSIAVVFEDQVTDRLAGTDRVRHADLLRSRLAMLHSSTFAFSRERLLEIGMFSEDIPGSMCEDWDVLLRASAVADIAHVDSPLVEVLWGATSFFSRRWETKVAAHLWMIEHHPDVTTDRVGAARLYGQLAFENAALKKRSTAARWAVRSLRQNPREMRGPIALGVCAGISPAWVLSTLHQRGRGI